MKKALSQTNPYLKDPALRRQLIRQSVISSGQVERIQPNPTIKLPQLKRRPKKIYHQVRSLDEAES